MIGKVETIGKGGRGIVFDAGKPVFIDGVLKGEVVEFAVTKKKHSVSFGSLKKIIDASPERITPPCPYYGVCGGCNFQHMAYREQVAVKQEILKSNLKRIAKINYPHPVEAITSPPFGYRTRAIVKVRDGRAGFFKKESHDIVEIDSCLLLPQIVGGFLRALKRKPVINGPKKGEILILTNGSELSALIKTDGNRTYLTDKKEISFNIGEFHYTYTPENFVQANLFTLESMTGLPQKSVGRDHFERAADLFCGAGFFTLCLTRRAGVVYSVEADTNNIHSLKTNLENNKIGNVKIMKADILKNPVPQADVYLIDPPRTGLNRQIIHDIAGHRPKKILYFSCDSATFCRDISFFYEAGYSLKELKIIDNFPQTDHFEIYSCLTVKQQVEVRS
ncbi:class I SAM-dependent RNA methyltransferase [Acidobacteriota bacterium]